MQFHYFLFPHIPDQLKAKENADERIHKVEDKDTWAREDAREDTWHSWMQCIMLTGTRLISIPSQSPIRMDH